MMGIKAGRLAISQYFDQYQAGWQTALSQIYIAYMGMAERYCHIMRNFSPHIVFGSVVFLLLNSFTIRDGKNSGKSYPRNI